RLPTGFASTVEPLAAPPAAPPDAAAEAAGAAEAGACVAGGAGGPPLGVQGATRGTGRGGAGRARERRGVSGAPVAGRGRAGGARRLEVRRRTEARFPDGSERNVHGSLSGWLHGGNPGGRASYHRRQSAGGRDASIRDRDRSRSDGGTAVGHRVGTPWGGSRS